MRGQRAASITERDVATSPTTPLVIAAGYLVAKRSSAAGAPGLPPRPRQPTTGTGKGKPERTAQRPVALR
jgi:hypothetical protein